MSFRDSKRNVGGSLSEKIEGAARAIERRVTISRHRTTLVEDMGITAEQFDRIRIDANALTQAEETGGLGVLERLQCMHSLGSNDLLGISLKQAVSEGRKRWAFEGDSISMHGSINTGPGLNHKLAQSSQESVAAFDQWMVIDPFGLIQAVESGLSEFVDEDVIENPDFEPKMLAAVVSMRIVSELSNMIGMSPLEEMIRGSQNLQGLRR